MESPLANVELHLVNSLEEALAFKRWLGERHEHDILGLDTESGGLSPYRNRLRMVQFGDTVHGWAIPADTWLGLAQEALRDYSGDWVLHNSPYDWQVLAENADVTLPWHKLHDTMALAHLKNPNRPRGLKALGDRLIDPRASAGQYLLHEGMAKQGWTWDTVPVTFDPYWIYSALDPVLTCHIYGKLKDARKLYAEPYDIERAAIRYTAEMSRRGIRIDHAYIQQKIDELTAYIENSKSWLKSEYGLTSVNASRQIANALEADGMDILFWTPNGQPQMDKDALKFYRNQATNADAANLVDVVTGVRKAEKMIGTYFQNFQEMCVGDRIHCSIHPCAAVTSRMSISDPSLQNLPTDDKLVRGSFVADDGHVLISSDFNQVEMRLAAHFSADPNLIETFRKADAPGGKAFFLQVASDIFGEEIDKLDKRYGLTKNVGYGYLFGAGLDRMAKTAGVTEDEMRPVRQQFLDSYAGLEEMSRKIQREAQYQVTEDGHPYVLTPTGRRLTGEKGKEYVLVNRKIQGHAAEVLKLAGVALDAAGLMDMSLLPIHDEYLFSVSEEDATMVREEIENTMKFTDYKVPITAGADILGKRWVKK